MTVSLVTESPLVLGEKAGGRVGWLKDSEGQVLMCVRMRAHADYCDAKAPLPASGKQQKGTFILRISIMFLYLFFFPTALLEIIVLMYLAMLCDT